MSLLIPVSGNMHKILLSHTLAVLPRNLLSELSRNKIETNTVLEWVYRNPYLLNKL